MDIDNNMDNSAISIIENSSFIKYPNTATELACSFLKEFIPNLDYVQLSDFKTRYRLSMNRYIDDKFAFALLISQFNQIDWEFVGQQIKEQQNVSC